jgi:hypothetical protein
MEINMNLNIDDEEQNKNDDGIQATTYLEIEEQEKSDDENIIKANNNKGVINDDDSELNLDLIINDISYIKKYLGKVLNVKDEKILNEKENNLYGYLNMENQNECENNLFMMLGNENTNFIEFLLVNKNIILFLYSIQKANTPEKKNRINKKFKA